MINSNVSQRLSARMKFKSLLLVSLLTGAASAQEANTPPVTLPQINLPSTNLQFPTSGMDASSIPSLPMTVPSLGTPILTAPPAQWDAIPPATDAVPNWSRLETPALPGSSHDRSGWSARQHATWLLGLRVRPSKSAELQPATPPVPMLDLPVNTPALAEAPALIESTLPPVVQLVQHTQPLAPPVISEGDSGTDAVSPAVHAQADESAVKPAHDAAPSNLNLRPVLGGPVPPLPLDSTETDSLLLVDVSGVDAAKVATNPVQPAPESLLDGFEFQKPAVFSLSDSQSPSVAASPSRSKRVSIHETFAPRTSSANHAAEVKSKTNVGSEAPERTEPIAKASKLSLSDRPLAPSSRPVETSLSDQGPLLTSIPAEVGGSINKSSRTGPLVEITPPSRVAKDSQPPRLLASTAEEATVKPIATAPVQPKSLALTAKPNESNSALPAVPEQLAEIVKPQPVKTEAASESLIDSVIPKPLPADAPKFDTLAAETKAKPSKLPESKRIEKSPASDTNPIALTRPVLKAATVAIPAAEAVASVVPTSHEIDDTAKQLAQYSKLAAKMQQAIKQKFPNDRIRVTCDEDGLIVEGHVLNNNEATKVLSYIRKASLCPVADRITTSH